MSDNFFDLLVQLVIMYLVQTFPNIFKYTYIIFPGTDKNESFRLGFIIRKETQITGQCTRKNLETSHGKLKITAFGQNYRYSLSSADPSYNIDGHKWGFQFNIGPYGKFFFQRTMEQIETKHGINVPYKVLTKCSYFGELLDKIKILLAAMILLGLSLNDDMIKHSFSQKNSHF